MATTKRKNSSNETQTVQSLVISREDILLEENKRLQLEVNKLQEEILNLRNKSKPKSNLVITDEELIAQLQLERIKFKALEQELTLEEIKKYDLLVKNKKLAEGNPTVIADYKKIPESLQDEELLQIASTSIKEDSANGQEE